MAGVLQSPLLREHTLAWALTASIVLHALLTLTASPFQFASEKITLPIEIRLLEPAPEPPPPVVQPPEPPKPAEPPPKSRPVEKPLPKPIEPVKTTPEPVVEAPLAPAPVVEAPPAPPPPPVMAAAPQPETPPVYTAPPPPPEPPGPTPQQVSQAKGNYGEVLARAFAKHKQYPRLAQMRGWQGTARIRLEIGADGSVTSTSVEESSGHDVLDRQALEMVKKATPLPQPPDMLRNQAFSVVVPITFRLE